MQPETTQFIAGIGGLLGLCLSALVCMLVAEPALTPPYSVEKLLALAWMTGSFIGSLALMAHFARSDLVSQATKLAGLIVGNVTATASIVVMPLFLIAACVPIFSGAVVVGELYRRSAGYVFAGFPIVVFLLRMLIGAFVSPLPAWL